DTGALFAGGGFPEADGIGEDIIGFPSGEHSTIGSKGRALDVRVVKRNRALQLTVSDVPNVRQRRLISSTVRHRCQMGTVGGETSYCDGLAGPRQPMCQSPV